jgi:UDP-N-acetyl-D-glucosamine dehydrogenase
LKTLNYNARFIELAAEINSHMPDYVVSKVGDALNDDCKSIKGSKVLVLGVAYKPNVSDVRESPALDVIHLLLERGALVRYNDPFVPDLAHEGFPLQSVDLTAVTLQESDCVVIVTNHASYDWQMVAEHTAVIVDTRNALKAGMGSGRVVTL